MKLNRLAASPLIALCLLGPLAACAGDEPAPESSNPLVEYDRFRDGKGELVQTANAELGDTTTEDIIATFRDINADLESNTSSWLGHVTGTVDDTEYVLGIATQVNTVEAIVGAHTGIPGQVATHNDTIDIFYNYCTESPECVEQSINAISGYADAFAAADQLTELSIAPTDASSYLTIYKAGGSNDPELYKDFIGNSLKLKQQLSTIVGVEEVSISPFYVYPDGDPGEYADVRVETTIAPPGSLCSEGVNEDAESAAHAVMDSVETEVPFKINTTCGLARSAG